MPSGLAQILMEAAESQNVYPFRDDHTVFFRVAYSITKEAVALSTRRTNDSEIIAGVWRHRHTLSWSQNYFRVAVMTNASRTLRLTYSDPQLTEQRVGYPQLECQRVCEYLRVWGMECRGRGTPLPLQRRCKSFARVLLVPFKEWL